MYRYITSSAKDWQIVKVKYLEGDSQYVITRSKPTQIIIEYKIPDSILCTYVFGVVKFSRYFLFRIGPHIFPPTL